MSTNYFDLVRRHQELVSYWRLNESGTAGQVIDYSAHNSLIGAYSGNPPVGPSLIKENDSSASSHQLGSGSVSVPDIAQLRMTSALSLEAWITPFANPNGLVVGKLKSSVAAPYSLSIVNGVLQMSVGNGTTQVSLLGPTVPTNIPSRVSGSLFRGNLYLCLNGTMWPTNQPVGSQVVLDGSQPLAIGGLSGYMAEVAVYNGALSALNHARHFAIGRQLLRDPAHFLSVDPPVYN
jgi:hypothetical protein